MLEILCRDSGPEEVIPMPEDWLDAVLAVASADSRPFLASIDRYGDTPVYGPNLDRLIAAFEAYAESESTSAEWHEFQRTLAQTVVPRLKRIAADGGSITLLGD